MLFHTPLLRAINLSIAVLLVLALAALYWYAWRPLPQTSGELAAPVAAEAAVVRDALGVPHITAASWQDAIFLQGYVTAQDRMWQMDMLRRFAAGELSEVLGTEQLDRDRQTRRLRLDRIADALEPGLTPAAHQILAAYARGVNYYLETQRGNLPVEFTILGYQPRPWRVRDTLLLGLNQYRMLTSSWATDLRKQEMLLKGDRDKVSYLFPPNLATSAAPGSNAWAVAGAHTATGKPILASDPHLEFNVPSLWYMLHLKTNDGELDVTGASLPGIPAVIIGHNRRIAWGLTNLEFDMQDLYRIQIDAQSGRYAYQAGAEQAAIERSPVAVKGQDAPTEVVTLVTRYGPLFVTDDNGSYALRWAAADTGGWDFPFLDLDRANNWEQFNAALRRYPGPAQNVVYADVDGNIGYHVAGPVPVRMGCAGDVPADGTAGACQWVGVVPYDELPQAWNPESGFIVSANQNPFPEDAPFPVSGSFASPDRARQIRARLESQDQWHAADMLAIQTDVYSARLHFLAQELLKAWKTHPASNQQSREAIEALRGWNGQMQIGQAAPMVAALTFEALRTKVVERAVGSSADQFGGAIPGQAVERLLRERPPDWFPDYDALLVDALASGIELGVRQQGSRVSRWDYGQMMRLEVPHPIFGRLPMIGRFFSIGPVAMSGSPTTVKQRSGLLGPSYRMVVDLANLDASLANIVGGESGHPLSRHYMDQWDAYYAGTSFPMQFEHVTAQQTLAVRPLD